MHESVVNILNKNSKSIHCSFAKLLTFSHRQTVMMVAWERHYVLKSESIRQSSLLLDGADDLRLPF